MVSFLHVLIKDVLNHNRASTKGMFTIWREEDPSTGKILEDETNFRLVYMQNFWWGWLLEIK